MSHFFSKQFRNLRFRTKILCIVGLVAMIPSLLVFALFYSRLLSLHRQRLEDIDRSFSRQADELVRQTDSVISNALQIGTNPELARFFAMSGSKADYVLEYAGSIRPLLSYMQSVRDPGISAVRIYTRNPNLFSTLNIQNIRAAEGDAFFNEISGLLKERRLLVRLAAEPRRYLGTEYAGAETLSVFVPILTSAKQFTFLECELSFEEYFQALRDVTNGFEDTGYVLYHSSGNVLFASDETLSESFLPLLNADASGESQRLHLGGRTYHVNFRSIPSVDCMLVSYSDLNRIVAPLLQSILHGVLVMLICVLFVCFLSITLVNGLLRRTESINLAIRQIQDGNFDVSVPVQGKDFIDQTAANLNAMAARIKDLIQNNYEKQLQIKNLQIRILSQQISPHFLYNTLEGLKMNAVLNGQNDIARALTSLGRLLRYYANTSSDFTSLESELKEVQDYVEIMNLIEEGGCTYEEQVPEECLAQTVPRFIIQPIVENAIRHAGQGQAGVLHIFLTAVLEDDRMRITVSDDGVGIPAETLLQLRQKMEDGQTSYKYGSKPSSIGLYNINARIKLIYGDAYGISVESVPGEGSRIAFTVPAHR